MIFLINDNLILKILFNDHILQVNQTLIIE
jgi:hypothetical protein